MTASFKRNLTAVFTNSATGTEVTLTGDEAYNFRRQYIDNEPIIIVRDNTNTETSYNHDCVCSLVYTTTKGEEYVAPECEPLFCPEPASGGGGAG